MKTRNHILSRQLIQCVTHLTTTEPKPRNRTTLPNAERSPSPAPYTRVCSLRIALNQRDPTDASRPALHLKVLLRAIPVTTLKRRKHDPEQYSSGADITSYAIIASTCFSIFHLLRSIQTNESHSFVLNQEMNYSDNYILRISAGEIAPPKIPRKNDNAAFLS